MCCTRAVLVDVAGDAERRQLAHFVGAGDRAAEDQNRQPAVVELADRAHQIDAGRVRQPQVEDDQIDGRRESARTRASSSAALLTATARCPAFSSALRNRSRTNAVSSATTTVFDESEVLAIYFEITALVAIIRFLSRSRLPGGFWHVIAPNCQTERRHRTRRGAYGHLP